MYAIHEVDGVTHQETIDAFNKLVPEWPPLESRHFDGFWWLAFIEDEPIAFAGLVAMEPFTNVGYLKRCYVMPDHLGHGLQFRLMSARIVKAKQLGWTHLVAECASSNSYSANNFRRAGFDLCEPEQRWGAADSVYWIKKV